MIQIQICLFSQSNNYHLESTIEFILSSGSVTDSATPTISHGSNNVPVSNRPEILATNSNNQVPAGAGRRSSAPVQVPGSREWDTEIEMMNDEFNDALNEFSFTNYNIYYLYLNPFLLCMYLSLSSQNDRIRNI